MTHAHTISRQLTSGCGVEASISSEEIETLLDAHNAARSSVVPPPYKPMDPLIWDANLASRAQELANKCV